MLARRQLFGLDFVNESRFDELVALIMAYPASHAEDATRTADTLPVVVTPDVDDVVRYEPDSDDPFSAVLRSAWLVLPEGQQIVLASRMLGQPLRGSLPGSLLFPEVWRKVAADRRRTVVVATSPAVAEGLESDHPDLDTVVPPRYEVGSWAEQGVIEDVASVVMDADAEFLFVGLGGGKQLRIILGVLEALDDAGHESPPLCFAVGSSLEMYLGVHPRPPALVQRLSLDWLFRLAREPARRARRYLIDDVRFFPLLARELRGAR